MLDQCACGISKRARSGRSGVVCDGHSRSLRESAELLPLPPEPVEKSPEIVGPAEERSVSCLINKSSRSGIGICMRLGGRCEKKRQADQQRLGDSDWKWRSGSHDLSLSFVL